VLPSRRGDALAGGGSGAGPRRHRRPGLRRRGETVRGPRPPRDDPVPDWDRPQELTYYYTGGTTGWRTSTARSCGRFWRP